jgi:hypothetical protein
LNARQAPIHVIVTVAVGDDKLHILG